MENCVEKKRKSFPQESCNRAESPVEKRCKAFENASCQISEDAIEKGVGEHGHDRTGSIRRDVGQRKPRGKGRGTKRIL